MFDTGPSNGFAASLLQRMRQQGMGMGTQPTMGTGQVPPMGSGDSNNYAMPGVMPGATNLPIGGIDTGPSANIMQRIMGQMQNPQSPNMPNGPVSPAQKPKMTMQEKLSPNRPGMWGKYNAITQALPSYNFGSF
jgi:hypothetical protein